MGDSKRQEKSQAERELLNQVHKLLGTNRSNTGGEKAPSTKLPAAKSEGISQAALIHGERASGLPRQLQAEAVPRASRSSNGTGGFSIGGNWLLSPIAGTIQSILGLFGVGNSTNSVTRYRALTREPFQIVEAISPETGQGAQAINESASGLLGVTSDLSGGQREGAGPGEGSAGGVTAALANAVRSGPRLDQRPGTGTGTQAGDGRRPTSTGSGPGPKGITSRFIQWVGSATSSTTQRQSPAKQGGSRSELDMRPGTGSESQAYGNRRPARAASIPELDSEASRGTQITGYAQASSGVERAALRPGGGSPQPITQSGMKAQMQAVSNPPPAGSHTAGRGVQAVTPGGNGRSLMIDRQALVSALRRSLNDSRGIADVLNEFQDGL